MKTSKANLFGYLTSEITSHQRLSKFNKSQSKKNQKLKIKNFHLAQNQMDFTPQSLRIIPIRELHDSKAFYRKLSNLLETPKYKQDSKFKSVSPKIVPSITERTLYSPFAKFQVQDVRGNKSVKYNFVRQLKSQLRKKRQSTDFDQNTNSNISKENQLFQQNFLRSFEQLPNRELFSESKANAYQLETTYSENKILDINLNTRSNQDLLIGNLSNQFQDEKKENLFVQRPSKIQNTQLSKLQREIPFRRDSKYNNRIASKLAQFKAQIQKKGKENILQKIKQANQRIQRLPVNFSSNIYAQKNIDSIFNSKELNQRLQEQKIKKNLSKIRRNSKVKQRVEDQKDTNIFMQKVIRFKELEHFFK